MPAKKTSPKVMAAPAVEATSAWIIREVSFATYKSGEEVSAARVTKSLHLLEGGVREWNRYRECHPRFRPYLRNTNLSWTNRHIPSLEEINLAGAELQDSDLTGQALIGADLTGASLERAVLVDTGLSEAILDKADLSWADLTEAHLDFASLDLADLTGANLTDAEMWNASLQGARLHLATLDYAEAREVLAMDADLSRARLLETDLEGADLSGANLSEALLVGTRLRSADLTRTRVYGSAVWDVDVTDAKQMEVAASREDQGLLLVDDLEVAQFLYLVINHEKLRKVMNAVTDRGVLLLGRFRRGGLELLQAIAARLRELAYLPIIFDFEPPRDRNYTETVKTLVGLSRFVIADLSGPSVPQELTATVPHFKVPFVPISRKGRERYAMVADILEYPWVVKPIVEFRDKAHLIKNLESDVIEPAERKHAERERLLRQLFDTVE